MNPNRKPFYPDVIVFYVCMVLAAWYFGYEYGCYETKKEQKVSAPVIQKQKLGMTKAQQTRWINYYRSRS